MDHIVFQFFKEISSIPRGSRNNQGISDYLVAFAKDKGFEWVQDESLNVIIKKPATQGYESCPPLILQGHMDMVCEKTPDSDHDFLTDGLELCVDGDSLYAEGTTLGGDDGIALAYALAVLSDDTIVHPALEAVFTTDEEIGLLGAAALDASHLSGKYMINLDSEEEGVLLVSCAGGLTADCRLPLSYEKQEGRKMTLTVKGLLGGHSGAEIDKNRVNATLLLGRLMHDLDKFSFRVISMSGGLKDNAIPREAVAEIVTTNEDAYTIINEVKFLTEKYKNECRASEPDLNIVANQGEEKMYSVLTKESYERVLFFLMSAPNGIQNMSPNIEGLVESSLNLGIFSMDENCALLSFSVRSSLSSYKNFLSDKLKMLTKHLGGEYGTNGDYPGWEYKKDSKLRSLYANAYKEVCGREIKIEAIHAGLECGIIVEKLGDIDIIAVGPNMQNIHTTEECLSISSAKRVYEILLKVLKDYCDTMK